jgi:hypothetical protein
MRRLVLIGLVLPALLVATPASAARPETWTVVDHDVTFTEEFPDDICGDRANTTTFTRKVEQVHLTAHRDGTFTYHDVAVVTYTSDYVDPSIPDVTGRLTEVNRFTFTRGEVFTATTTFHDFFGDVRIFVRFHLTDVGGTIRVEREVLDVSGCP